MNRSSDRILTTHTGSLPRPGRLAEQLAALEAGSLDDAERRALAERVRTEVAQLVARQVEVGMDVLSDGEMSKFSYTSYVQQRLTGFDGTSVPLTLSEFADFPGLAAGGTFTVANPSCTGPVAFCGAEALAADIANLTSALHDTPEVEGFMNAASPGMVWRMR